MKVLALLAVLLLAFSVATATEVQACETCKFLVGLIQSEVKGKETQITDAFKKAVCSRLGELEAPCTAFVDAYGKQAVDFIVQKLDADEVCHKLSLCDNAEWVKKIFTEQSAAKLIKFALEQESNNQLCDMCQFVVNEAEQYLNKSEPDVEKALVKACGMLPPQLTGICDMIVLTYGHQIIQYIIKYENATIVCQQLGLCSKKDAPVQIPEAIVKGTAGQCELCKFLVTTVENYLKDNATEAKIQSQLESLCKFTGSYSEQCIQIVDEYLPYIIYYVTENYDADKICQLVGICTKKAEATFEKAEALPTCAICQWVVTEIEHLVSKEITEKKVQDALGKVCDIVPNTFRGACIDLVNTYAPIIIQKVLEKATPAQVCAAVKACKTEVKVEEPKPMKAQDGLCELCKQVTTYLENLIQSNATSAQIIAALTKVCDVVPSQFKAQCQVAIPLVWQTLVKKLLDKETPEQVCKQVHFCPATAEVEVKPVEKVQPTFIPEDENNMVCDGCKQLVAIANNFITKNSTEQQIITYIEQACDFFPDSYKGLCKVVVEQYGPALLEKLAQQVLQPDTVCKAVKACPTKMDPALKRVLMAQPVQRIRLN